MIEKTLPEMSRRPHAQKTIKGYLRHKGDINYRLAGTNVAIAT